MRVRPIVLPLIALCCFPPLCPAAPHLNNHMVILVEEIRMPGRIMEEDTLPSRALELTFLHRRAPGGSGLSYAAQFSGDLATWTGGQTPVVTSLSSDWERVTIRDTQTGQNRRRGRVAVTFAP